MDVRFSCIIPVMGSGSDFLFAMPSFLSGLARTLDIGSTFDAYNQSKTTAEADSRAIVADWCAVGFDLRAAMQTFDLERPEPAQMSLAIGRE